MFPIFQATANALSTVITQRIGRLLLVGLNRPHRSNSIDRKTARDLCHVIRNEFERDENILGGVLYGEGIDFCTGLDFDQLSDEGPDFFGDANSVDTVRPMGPTNFAFTKPLIAAITGRAIGGGLELALACDLRVAEEDSLLGLHPRKYCMPMMDMGAIRLPALIGLSRALDLTLTGRSLTASEALQFGLVNRVAKLGTAVGIAVQMVDKMCSLPGQAALRADRENLLQAYALRYDLEKVEFERAMKALRSESHLGLTVYRDELEMQASRKK
ncbi:hypothetical protein CRM22_004564 [Opisthorchis felineus]|uniref:Enoyl-CoA hydratase n=1 Tax=Opisthorchis felineus TaxID=147828 RepID=A0A4S2LVH8_OPIFE|nr:hypothetical protein CRM22_004564 [Opisthorchis felineus]